MEFEKNTSSSLISSAGGFGNGRNNDTNFDNGSDFMIVIRSKRFSFRFDHCFNIDLTLFKISTEYSMYHQH